MKKELTSNLNKLESKLKETRAKIKEINTVLINPGKVKNEVAELCDLWNEDILLDLKSILGADNKILQKYHDGFVYLLNISGKRNKRESYEKTLKDLLKNFHKDLLIPVTFATKETHEIDNIEKLFEGIEYPDQKSYLKEALNCAKANCLRGCVVLGWSAAMHHIHCKVEEIGFDTFNVEMEKLKNKGSGRFKAFKGFSEIESISDIRETPDRKILVVLDGMNLIDSNQRQRLEHCLDLRIHASHPGDAPITFPNLFSFFSDINEIIFKNPKFEI